MKPLQEEIKGLTEFFPEEVLLAIVDRLPKEARLIFAQVCKTHLAFFNRFYLDNLYNRLNYFNVFWQPYSEESKVALTNYQQSEQASFFGNRRHFDWNTCLFSVEHLAFPILSIYFLSLSLSNSNWYKNWLRIGLLLYTTAFSSLAFFQIRTEVRRNQTLQTVDAQSIEALKALVEAYPIIGQTLAFHSNDDAETTLLIDFLEEGNPLFYLIFQKLLNAYSTKLENFAQTLDQYHKTLLFEDIHTLFINEVSDNPFIQGQLETALNTYNDQQDNEEKKINYQR